MNKKENKKNDNNSNNNEDIEVIIGDESIITISEVGDCMNDLRPKDSVSNRKNVIIPKSKNNAKKDIKKESNDTSKDSKNNED